MESCDEEEGADRKVFPESCSTTQPAHVPSVVGSYASHAFSSAQYLRAVLQDIVIDVIVYATYPLRVEPTDIWRE
jgi:hypothetical protein